MTYKERLVYLNILPLMYHLELADVMFFINLYKNPSSRFDISKNTTVATGTTRSSDNLITFAAQTYSGTSTTIVCLGFEMAHLR